MLCTDIYDTNCINLLISGEILVTFCEKENLSVVYARPRHLTLLASARQEPDKHIDIVQYSQPIKGAKSQELIPTRITTLSADDGLVTLGVTNSHVIYCQSGSDTIHVESIGGSSGQGSTGKVHLDTKESLNSPYICDVDDEGSVLIADQGNNKLKVMDKDGKFDDLKLEPDVIAPRNAVLYNGHIYVTSSYDNTIIKYEAAE